MFSRFASRLLNTAKDSLSTTRCELCGAWPSDTTFAICNCCLARHVSFAQRCSTCGLRFQGVTSICHACVEHPISLDQCIIGVDYVDPWVNLLQRFKFQQETGWADALGHLLYQRLHTYAHHHQLLPTDWVIPIPMHLQALSERGYNQSWLLCQSLKKKLNVHPMEQGHTWQFRHDVLLKTSETQQQHHLNRSERLHNLQSAFAVSPHVWSQLQGRSIALVDDIMTTGSTLHAAATALRQQGAAHVHAWVLARTPFPSP